MHSGVLADDWGSEYVEMTGFGWDMYLHTLSEYLAHFAGRPGTYVYAEGPQAPQGRDAWRLVTEALGLSGPVAVGDRVTLTPDGLDPIEGIVDYGVPDGIGFLAVRGPDVLYRFHGRGRQVDVGHHVFADGVDAAKAAAAWAAWLKHVLAA